MVVSNGLTAQERALAKKFADRWQKGTAEDFLDSDPKMMQLLDDMIANSEMAEKFETLLADQEEEREDDPHRIKKQLAKDILAAGATIGAFFIPIVGPAVASSIASSYIASRFDDKDKEEEQGDEQGEEMDSSNFVEFLARKAATYAGNAVGGPVLGLAAETAVAAASKAIKSSMKKTPAPGTSPGQPEASQLVQNQKGSVR